MELHPLGGVLLQLAFYSLYSLSKMSHYIWGHIFWPVKVITPSPTPPLFSPPQHYLKRGSKG